MSPEMHIPSDDENVPCSWVHNNDTVNIKYQYEDNLPCSCRDFDKSVKFDLVLTSHAE